MNDCVRNIFLPCSCISYLIMLVTKKSQNLSVVIRQNLLLTYQGSAENLLRAPCLLAGLAHWAVHPLALRWSRQDSMGPTRQLESAPCVLHVPAGHLRHVLMKMTESQGRARPLELQTWSHRSRASASFYWLKPAWSIPETEAEDASELNGKGDAGRVKNQGCVCNQSTTTPHSVHQQDLLIPPWKYFSHRCNFLYRITTTTSGHHDLLLTAS